MATSLISRTDPSFPPPLLALKPSRATAPEFRLLGLEPREARVEVIRLAVAEAAAKTNASFNNQANGGDSRRLTDVAVAGYHLLDPRRRRTQFERIQLLLWTEDDQDAQAKPLRIIGQSNPLTEFHSSSTTEEPSMITAQLTRVRARPAYNLGSPPAAHTLRDERQAALAVFRSIQREGRLAKVIWAILACLSFGLISALVVSVAILG